ncbi:MAG: AAA family ATPase [Pseudomonadota bacterium]
MADVKDLSMILDANIPIIAIESPDERRVLALLLQLAVKRGASFHQWTATRGLERGGVERQPPQANGWGSRGGADDGAAHTDPEELLQYISQQPGPGLYALCDFHPYLKGEPTLLRHLKDIALDFDLLHNTLILISHRLDVPAEVGRLTAKFNLRLPSDDELMALTREVAGDWSRINGGAKVKTDHDTLKKLISNLRGVSHADARVLVRHAVFNDGAITESDLPSVNKLKFELLDSEGVLRFEYDTEVFSNVAGLNNLKHWLSLRQDAFLSSTSDRPRGMMLLGVQGGGKSLAAKAVAGYWGLPLLRLDFGALYNKFFGETERNLRNSLSQAELMAPCVLWMDEIEKGLATGQSDNATSQRVLGTLLTWMAENQKSVFIVATSNDITSLPPELVRKGRLDEVFFVDLPNSDVRAEIFRIHLRKREMDPSAFDLDALARATDGFTGAEIEESIVSARYQVSARTEADALLASEVTTDDLLAAVRRTYPVSVMHAESINRLRNWAEDRTVIA